MSRTLTRREMLLGMTAASFMLSAYTTDAETNNEDLSVQAMAEGQAGQPAPQTHWQGEVSFPDWMGTPSDTLAPNSMYSYLSYHGQGTIQVSVADEVEDFSLYINGHRVDTYLKQTFFGPMGLDHITYNPLKAGFSPDDCAATELNGNTRDHSEYYEGYRTQTLQGEVHDEKAYYNMAGVSGHAGLFASATNLATLASVMLTGGYGEHRFFSKDVMDAFVAPKSEKQPTWGLGWYRNADAGRTKYFGTQSSRGTVGHQGWTGTLTMIDPSRNLVVAYLTNKINSPVTDVSENPDRFDGNWYTAATLGFIPQIISIGMDTDQDVSHQLLDLAADMAVESIRLIPESAKAASDHPSVRNFESKCELFEKLADGCADADRVVHLRNLIEQART